MSNIVRVPFSKNMVDCAQRIELFLEHTKQNSSEFYIASVSVCLFLDFLLLGEDDKTIIAMTSDGHHDIPFETIYEYVGEKPIDHWELVEFPEDFLTVCKEIAHRCCLDSVEDGVLISIGYLSELVRFVEMGMQLFVAEYIDNESCKIEHLQEKIFDAYRPFLIN
ncbi:MAG: hypothetical protein WCT07_02835 [Candidatus Paceibacterota bacterium]|jgi:hypothetical protein